MNKKEVSLMPYVNVRITEDGTTSKQKEEVIRRITDTMVEVLGKNRGTIAVVIDEVPHDNWGLAGESSTNLSKKDNS